jgi:hypothetical protein
VYLYIPSKNFQKLNVHFNRKIQKVSESIVSKEVLGVFTPEGERRFFFYNGFTSEKKKFSFFSMK